MNSLGLYLPLTVSILTNGTGVAITVRVKLAVLLLPRPLLTVSWMVKLPAPSKPPSTACKLFVDAVKPLQPDPKLEFNDMQLHW
jgi:hypothetical protein